LNKKYDYNKREEKGFKKFINCRKKNIEIVKLHGLALHFVKEQDIEICMKAVKQ
jgi:phosphopantetheine adenylyltransferase